MDDGGPAFPRPRSEGNLEVYDAQQGLSLRDWFAGHALQGMLAKPSNIAGMHDSYAEDAYRYADEMLKVRKDAKA